VIDIKNFVLSNFIQHDGADVIRDFQNLKRKNTLSGTSSRLRRNRMTPKQSKCTLLIFRETPPPQKKESEMP
jgi:hypothetical protein